MYSMHIMHRESMECAECVMRKMSTGSFVFGAVDVQPRNRASLRV